jgi:hypothetical protein
MMVLTAKERRVAAQIRRLPAGDAREFLESMLPDRGKAVERFRKYARRAQREMMAWQLEWMSLRICLLLDGSAGAAALDGEIKAEEEERKRRRERLKMVRKRN